MSCFEGNFCVPDVVTLQGQLKVLSAFEADIEHMCSVEQPSSGGWYLKGSSLSSAGSCESCDFFFGNGNFDIMQRFVWCVADLTSGRRLALGSCFDPRHHGRHVVPLLCIGVGFSATCMTEKDNPTSQVLILEGWILCTGRVCFTYLCTTSAISVWWCEVGEVTIHNHDC